MECYCFFIATNSYLNSMEQSPSWEDSSHSASREVTRLLRNSKVHYRVHKSPQLLPILSQIYPVNTFSPYFPQKVVPVLNQASRHEDVLGSGGIAPRILDIGTRWRWVVSFRPRPLYPRERAPGTHWIGGWVGPKAVLDTVMKRKIPSPRRESNPRIPIVQLVAQRHTDWAITALLKLFPIYS
jgi:hypothetical protein